MNVDHVNVGRIIVENQSMQSQQKAGKLALAQVFIKLSGNESVLLEPEVSRAVDNYEQFLISSSFLQQSGTLVFEASFNQNKIENLLLASGLSVWASLRPSSVLWIALENTEKQKLMVSQLSAAQLSQKLRLQSFARGIEIVMPLGDLEDSMNVSVYDIWNQNIAKLQRQSNRYATDYLISATVQAYNQQQASSDQQETASFYDRNNTASSANFASLDDTNTLIESAENDLSFFDSNSTASANRSSGQQKLMVDTVVPKGTTHKLDYVIAYVDPTISKKVMTGRIFGDGAEMLILKVVDLYANMLAKEFALSATNKLDTQTIQLVFTGIDSLQDYVNLMSLIRSIPAVENVRLIRQSGMNAVLEIQQNMSVMQLKSILSIDDRVSAISTTTDAEISFRWLGQ